MRTKTVLKNYVWVVFSNLIIMIISFATRGIFIKYLGITYLGVNGLFSSILSMLSLAELGIGLSISFNLYKPLAEKNYEKISSLMQFYKKTYRIIALVIFISGFIISLFLNVLIKTSYQIQNLQLIFFLFIINTCSTYLLSYKRTLIIADQKNYVLNRINIFSKIILNIMQISIIIITKNFVLYLVGNIILSILENLFVNDIINKEYNYINLKSGPKLNKDTSLSLKTNIKAVFLHNIGAFTINSTDNIIISIFLNIQSVGLLSNYNIVISSINTFVSSFFNSITASFGNLIVQENENKQYEVFGMMSFISLWIYGWCAICFYYLLTPFIVLWIGHENTLNNSIVVLILVEFYLRGQRTCLDTVKASYGLYHPDRFDPLIQSLINLVISIILVKYIGLEGVLAGTAISSITFTTWRRPYFVYKYIFNVSVKKYYSDLIKNIGAILICIVILNIIFKFSQSDTTIFTFIIRSGICIIVPNLVFYIIYRNSNEFKNLKNKIVSMIKLNKGS